MGTALLHHTTTSINLQNLITMARAKAMPTNAKRFVLMILGVLGFLLFVGI